MKIREVLVLFFIIISCSFYSCSEDGDGGFSNRQNQENVVKLKVWSNTPGVPIRLDCHFGQPLTIKDKWEGEYVTKQYGAQLTAICDDNTVLITTEIYVNGKLKKRKEGNSYVMLGVDLK